MKKCLLACVSVLSFGVSTPAYAETRGEAFLKSTWAEIPTNSGLYQLGSMNTLGFQQASQSLINEGAAWCNIPIQFPQASSGMLALDLRTYLETSESPDSVVSLVAMKNAYQIICPEFIPIYQQARQQLIQQGVTNEALQGFGL